MTRHELYRMAFKFRETKLWENVADSELFAVRLDEHTTGYCSVMGMLGEHVALALYIADSGFETYRNIACNEYSPGFIFEQDCIQLSLENAELLDKIDIDEAKKYAYRFNKELTGENAYPVFLRYSPFRIPWDVTDKTDMEYLAIAVQCSVEVANNFEKFLQYFEGKYINIEQGGTVIPLICMNAGAFEWKETTLPAPVQRTYETVTFCDDLVAQTIKKRKKAGVWECELLAMNSPVDMGEGNPPAYPELLLCVDAGTGMVLNGDALAVSNDDYMDLVKGLANVLLDAKGMPAEIRVRNEKTQALLQSFCEKCGITLTLTQETEFLEEVTTNFARDFGFGEEIIGEQMQKLLDLFESADEQMIADMPEVIASQIKRFVETGVLPEKFIKLFNKYHPDTHDSQTANNVLEFPGINATIPKPSKIKSAIHKKSKHSSGNVNSYVISVAYDKGIFRHLRVSAKCTLKDFHAHILKAFSLDYEKKHAFFPTNSIFSDKKYTHRKSKSSLGCTDDVRLCDMGLKPEKRFKHEVYTRFPMEFSCRIMSESEEVVDGYVLLKSSGDAFIWTFRTMRADLPKKHGAGELNKAYASLGLSHETLQNLHLYFTIFAYFYGMIPVHEAHKIYNMQNDKISLPTFIKFTEIARHDRSTSYAVAGNEIFFLKEPVSEPKNRYICDDFYIEYPGHGGDLLSKQSDKPFYVPEKSEMLKYADPYYNERTDEYVTLERFLKIDLKVTNFREIAEHIFFSIKAEKQLKDILNEITEMGVNFPSQKKHDYFVALSYELHNNTKMRLNCGYTPHEMSDFFEDDEDVYIPALPKFQPSKREEPKTGRNDKCPCGSGKKYKNCCLNK